MAAPGITLIKSMTYDGDTEEWSNQYHTGEAADNPTDWRAMVDGLVDVEKTVYTSRITIIRALCYEDTDNDSVYTYELADFDGTVAGTLSPGSALHLPGDTANWVRWDTGLVGSGGKKIYLRKYFHDVLSDGSPSYDNILAAQKTALEAFGVSLLDGLTGGFHMCDKNGRNPDGPSKANTYATTRTLHRRGRRPS